jgi:uncharacterized Zn-finger protein
MLVSSAHPRGQIMTDETKTAAPPPAGRSPSASEASATDRPSAGEGPPPEVIEVEETVVACDGGGGALGHPRVFLNLVDGAAECGYCDRRFVLKPGAKPRAGH